MPRGHTRLAAGPRAAEAGAVRRPGGHGDGQAANTAVPVCLGQLVNAVNPAAHGGGSPSGGTTRVAIIYLALIAGAYFLRESMNVLRRYIVERTCTRINKDMSVRLMSHLMKVDLVGAGPGPGRGSLRPDHPQRRGACAVPADEHSWISSPPCSPAGSPLPPAFTKQPRIALAMLGVVPISLVADDLAAHHPEGHPAGPVADARGHGRHGGRACRGDRLRPGRPYPRQEIRRVARTAERQRSKEIRHHFEMSLFGCGKAINEGFFHILVLAWPSTCSFRDQIRLGDIMTFSVLYLNVMCPLNEIHRFIDEAHESSLPNGRSHRAACGSRWTGRSRPGRSAEAASRPGGADVVVTEGLSVVYRATSRPAPAPALAACRW